MELLFDLIISHNRLRVNKHSIGQSTLYITLYYTIYSVFVTVIAFITFELLNLLFVFALFVCTMNFLLNVLFVGNMRRFRKLLSKSSSTSIPEEKSESGIEKSL